MSVTQFVNGSLNVTGGYFLNGLPFTSSSGTIGGSNTQIIFNQNGSSTGSSNLIFDYTTNQLTLSGTGYTHSLIPQSDDVYTLGTPDLRYNHLYVGTGSISIGNATLTSSNSTLIVNGGIQTTNLNSDIGSYEYPFKSIYVSTGSILVGQSGALEINNNGLMSSVGGFAAPYYQVGSINPGSGITMYQLQDKLFYQNQFGASGPVSVFNVQPNSINNYFFTGGNLGFNTNAPNYLMDVNGTGHFVSLIVDNITGALNGLPVTNDFTASNFDAFQRLRVSNPFTLFDSSMIYKDNGKFDTYSTGASSTGTFNADQSTMFLTVGSASGSEVLRQSYRVFPYQPGKSLLAMNSFVMNSPVVNLIQRVGYFNSQNGFFLELADSNVYLVQRSYVTGSVVETRVLQSNWNIDTFDGNGPSGIVLDLSKSQIFISDFEWLGVGTVRCGFVIGGNIYYAHYFNHANITTSTYITTASLPVSYQIKTTGETSGGYTLKQICSTVLSEGGYQASSPFYTKGTNLSTLTIAASPTITPIVSIRIKSGRPCAIVIPAELELLLTTADTIQWFLIMNGTLNTSSYVSYSNTSNVETDQTATTITGGTILKQGFGISSSQSKTSISLTSPEVFNFQLGVSIAGVSDVVTLAASTLSGTSDLLGFLGWYELN